MKPFKSYDEQISLLLSRGLIINDVDGAREILRKINYYRLSAYWYPFRQLDQETHQRKDAFIAGTTFDQIVALYHFDTLLRQATFETVSTLETTFRALLGHELGRIDPYIYLDAGKLGKLAQQKNHPSEPSDDYRRWLKSYDKKLESSHEDFVSHHIQHYQGLLPIWVAVEVMDFGALSYLFRFSPLSVQEGIAGRVALSAPQLASWLKSLNILRNCAAHHARMFNRSYSIRPRLPQARQNLNIDAVRSDIHRTFGQLTLIQYLLDALELPGQGRLPQVIRQYPESLSALPIRHIGAPDNWESLSLWK